MKKSLLSVLWMILPVLATVLLVGCGKKVQSSDEPTYEATISVPGFESLTLTAGKKKQELRLSNPETNTCYFQIELVLEDGTSLWISNLIAPGKTSKNVTLDQTLSAGTYNAKLLYHCYAMDKTTPLNGAEIKLTLNVK